MRSPTQRRQPSVLSTHAHAQAGIDNHPMSKVNHAYSSPLPTLPSISHTFLYIIICPPTHTNAVFTLAQAGVVKRLMGDDDMLTMGSDKVNMPVSEWQDLLEAERKVNPGDDMGGWMAGA